MSVAKMLEERENVAAAPSQNVKIELRRVSYSARLSEETSAFAADVYVNGKKAGHAQNDGHGGETMVHLDPAIREAVRAWVAALPPRVIPAGGGMDAFTIEPSIEDVVDDLLDQYLRAKDLAKAERNVRKEAARVRAAGFVPVLVWARGAYVVTCSKTETEAELVATTARIAAKHRDMKRAVGVFVPQEGSSSAGFVRAVRGVIGMDEGLDVAVVS